MAHFATNHWSLLNDMEREMRRFMGHTTASKKTDNEWTPAVDIVEEDERFILMLEIPGVDPQTIDVSVEDNVLSISGSRKADEISEKAEVHRRERRAGDFKRSFTLPDSVQADGISATGKFGVLEVNIPKKPVEGPRRIPVTH